MNKKAKIAVIGSGISGLAAAGILGKENYEVHLFEKNSSVGGRLRKFESDGFTFDMGPSWYWMPEIFEEYYAHFDKKTSDFYHLRRLDPSYQVIFKDEELNISADLSEVFSLFEKRDPGSAERLLKFLEDARYKYSEGMKNFVWKPGLSWTEYLDPKIARAAFRMNMLNSIKDEINEITRDKKLQQILEFPVLFLGAKPRNTPAMYSLMNYADLVGGTWYPEGGMHKIVEAMKSIALDQDVIIHTESPVEKINVKNNRAESIVVNGSEIHVDAIVGSGDYHHIEKELLDEENSQYSDEYWNSRVMSPSSLLFYIGLDEDIDSLDHHNLFFDTDFEKHAEEIYDEPRWPSNPLFYACMPSKSDNSVAPKGKANLFILMPLAAGLEDSDEMRKKYFKIIENRLLLRCNYNLSDHIEYFRSYAMSDFKTDYNSYKGNAYGLANTLTQTAFLKPSMKTPFVRNMIYAGQLTNPGPGLPPSLISGQIAAQLIQKLNLSNS